MIEAEFLRTLESHAGGMKDHCGLMEIDLDRIVSYCLIRAQRYHPLRLNPPNLQSQSPCRLREQGSIVNGSPKREESVVYIPLSKLILPFPEPFTNPTTCGQYKCPIAGGDNVYACHSLTRASSAVANKTY